ncbi:MAG: TlpA family protein disulfide reductase [Pyrinomonadaceae bacterium]|nr:TlpA family protein disulfide reductase [Pyrinomonadaceae bacterium]
MKNLLKNTLLFIALGIAFSNLMACTNSSTATNSQKGAVIEVAPNASTNANPINATAPEIAEGIYPAAPDAILKTENKDLEGNVLKIEDYKGKVVLINLWATWCGPCRGEMPHLVEMQDKYRDKGFVVIGLDVDEESVEEINAFAKQMNLNYQLGYADPKMVSAFIKLTKLQGIPQTILVNREGKMTGIFSGGGQRVIGQMKEAVEKTVNNG